MNEIVMKGFALTLLSISIHSNQKKNQKKEKCSFLKIDVNHVMGWSHFYYWNR